MCKTKLTFHQKRKIKDLRDEVLSWAKTNGMNFAWRKNPTIYSVLIAEIFLQRTRAPQAEKQYVRFMRKYPTFTELKKAQTPDLVEFLQPLGLKKRLGILEHLISEVEEEYLGEVPVSYGKLKDLPGVGDYTASAILIFALNEPAGIVDTNTIKIFSELFNLKLDREKGKGSEFIKNCAEYYSSLGDPRDSNWALLDYAIKKGSVRTEQP